MCTEGHRARFTGVVSPDLICPLCLLVCREALMIPGCCHTCCRSCFTQFTQFCATMGAAVVCPVDRQGFTLGDVISAGNIDRQIMKLKVRCYDCAWDGVLRELEEHILACPMVLLQRQNKYLREQLSTLYSIMVGIHASIDLEPPIAPPMHIACLSNIPAVPTNVDLVVNDITSPMHIACLSNIPAVPTNVDLVVNNITPLLLDTALPTFPDFPGDVVAELFRQLESSQVINIDSS